MKDIIYREDAVGVINGWLKQNHFPAFGEGILYLVPSADRPQGEWIMSDIQNEADVLNGNYAYVCTNCNHTDIHAKTQKVPYCWWCGARMKGADDVLEGDR